jgi:NADH dehydrogenase/NADH:ubiquinone oxidoreductase subunit G
MKIYIDGKECTFNVGETILDVAERNNLYIPTLCYYHKIKPTGACRLCLVEIENCKDLAAACETYAVDGMSVLRDTPEVVKERAKSLEQVLIKHPLDCPICDKGGECLLQDVTYKLGIKETNIILPKPAWPLKEWGLILYNQNLCVLCERCTKLCHTVNGTSALHIEGNAFDCKISPKENPLMCDFCGICVDNCPVGALLDIPFKHLKRVWDIRFTKSYCVLCPIGCEIEYGIHENTIIKARSMDASMICGMGRYGFQYVNNPERLKTALVKENGTFKDCSVEEAVKLSTEKIEGIINNFGADSVAILLGSRLSNESVLSIKTFAEHFDVKKILSDIDFYDRGFFKYYKKFFNTYLPKGKILDIEKSDFVFILGADLSREFISLKWPIMKAITENEAQLLTLGLKKYDYDEFVDYALLADSGNFSQSINNIVYSNNAIFKKIRHSLEKVSSISLIIGDEYILHEEDFNSLYFLVKFLGFDKIKVILGGLNKGNFRSLLLQNLYNRDYSTSQLVKDLKDGKIKALLWANFYPYDFLNYSEDLYDLLKDVKYKVALDMFNNKFNELADIIIPVKASYEREESYITLDGKVIKTEPIIDDKFGLMTESLYFSSLIKQQKLNIKEELKFLEQIPITYYDNEQYYIDTSAVQFNECEYKYKLIENVLKDVFINQRYHNGLTTGYAFRIFEDNDFKKTYLSSDYESEDRLIKEYEFAKGIKIHLKKFK